jgi:hypothetical protein
MAWFRIRSSAIPTQLTPQPGTAELRDLERAVFWDSPTYAVRVQVLIVDGANVVGGRPDGWWRDRAGAARRLQERLSTAVLPHDGTQRGPLVAY